MRWPSQALRLAHINWILLRHGLDEVLLAAHLFRSIRFLRYFAPWYWLRGALPPRGERIRLALEELGPIFVKFGQILSTRRDLLPDDVADELAKLQDQVPPFAGARAILEQAYKQPLDQVFARFDDVPFASASVAQVHGARLHDGREAVCKVLRPNIEKVIRRDVGLLYNIADLAERYWREGRRLRPREIVAEYEKTILDELDLLREAANLSMVRRNFEASDDLHVPEVHWHHTNSKVLVMERVSGIPISDIEELRRQHIDFELLAARGVEIFFTQVFRDNFFHADMHPGNIFVSPRGTYVAVDFGIMGSLSPSDQRYLAENFIAFFNHDYRRVAELHVASGWVPSGTRVDEFEAAIRSVCEPIFARPLAEISFGHLLLRLFQTARRFDMEVQPQLVLLQKTLLNIEGLGRQLYPELDLWGTAKPYLEDWMAQQLGPQAFLKRLGTALPQWSERLPQLPALMHDVLTQAASGELRMAAHSREIEKLRQEMRRSNERTVTALAGSCLILSGMVVLALDGFSPTMLGGAPLTTWLLCGAGAVLMLAAWPQKRD